MSRCFPYPPPGYTLSKSVEEALIESIKLHKERFKAKEQNEERRKEKQEKKEKRREFKEREKEIQEKVKLSLEECDSFKKGHTEESILPNADQLEKSGLTEEHDQPICFRSTSSESSEDSNKRKAPLPTENNRGGYGKIIRIKLSSRKLDVSSNSCLPSGKTDIPIQTIPHEGASGFVEARANNEVTCSTSGNTLGFEVPFPDESLTSAIQKQESQYRNLTENIVLPQFLDSCLTQDNDWLFCSRGDVKRHKYNTDIRSCLSSSSSVPIPACYIPQVDVYALPYTIPF